MHEINRSAIILKPKQAFVDWLHSVPDPGDFITLESLLKDGDHSLYLVPEAESLAKNEALAEALAFAILEEELGRWYTDPDAWPENLDYKTLTELFDVELFSQVTDTLETSLSKIRED